MKKGLQLIFVLLIAVLLYVCFLELVHLRRIEQLAPVSPVEKITAPQSNTTGTSTQSEQTPNNSPEQVQSINTGSPVKGFSQPFLDGTLGEAGSISKSTDLYWWLSSGAYFYAKDHIGTTILGALNENDPWRIDYGKNNPGETDNGYHPQNIFRLVLKSEWHSYIQQAYYNIDTYNLSKDSHRQASNGLFLFNRYQDANNLYYTGLRVDGSAVIKKKYKGIYYEMNIKPFLAGVYNRDSSPNLIPLHQWIGIRSEVSDLPGEKVDIKFYVDINDTGNWKLAVEAIDDGKSYGGPSILEAGHAGLRTDFMDVQFKDYQIREI